SSARRRGVDSTFCRFDVWRVSDARSVAVPRADPLRCDAWKLVPGDRAHRDRPSLRPGGVGSTDQPVPRKPPSPCSTHSAPSLEATACPKTALMLSRAGTARAGCVMPAIVTPVFALSASLAFSESFDVTLINGTG